jgi:hypothetical protein
MFKQSSQKVQVIIVKVSGKQNPRIRGSGRYGVVMGLDAVDP